ncbi:helix-turn-helix domain-containing protein [Mahella australiensis]|uniref:Helix-turn-helix domain protein n=1 Tax=Mahella australiensis (strain DSM 15567 / CIP 107919 / 50-1 BON) TaxID=697281 RepID=F3ZYR6_MAHA5|nr:helix-turn-helix domain-containing protein [Mahella australiensis]AEE95661.1 helix-turn-helix domain protein [Mahella australiensis 50-1 BON]
MDDFGKLLMDLRNAKQLTQEDVAEKLGVSRQTISSWETNRTKPNYDQIKQICAILEVDMNTLLGNGAGSNKKSAKQVSNIFPILVTLIFLFHMIMGILNIVPIFCVIITAAFIWAFYLIINTIFRSSIKKNDYSMIAGYKAGVESFETTRRKLASIDLFSGIFSLLCELLFFMVYFDRRQMMICMVILGVFLSFEIVINLVVNMKYGRK